MHTMNKTHRLQMLLQIFVLSIFLLVSAWQTHAQSTPHGSLRGLAAVPVKVQVSKGTGTTSGRLREFVELRLRRAGIIVPENNMPSRLDGYAMLSLTVVSSEDSGNLLSVNLNLTQDVTLKRRPSIEVRVATWEASQCGDHGESNEANVQRWVAELIDSFINDYLAVNQK